ncbi:hypothetical protein ACHAWF_001912 [Thalassiosira exigua]
MMSLPRRAAVASTRSIPPTRRRRLWPLGGALLVLGLDVRGATGFADPAVDRSRSPTHLDDVEDAVEAALSRFRAEGAPDDLARDLLRLSPRERESVGVASNLRRRLEGLGRSGDCRRCWLQRKHCVCDACVPLEGSEGGGIPKVDRLFLLTHHKEIGLTVDTAKLILAAFPFTSRLVVAGMGRECQPSMGEMLDAVSDAARGRSGGKCLILFPTEDARTFDEIEEELRAEGGAEKDEAEPREATPDRGWDVVVLDGTWSQARKMHAKYLAPSRGNLRRVRLGDDAVRALDGIGASEGDGAERGTGAGGLQLRRHPIKVRPGSFRSLAHPRYHFERFGSAN